MIIKAKDYDSAFKAIKDALTIPEIKKRMPTGDAILIYIDPKAEKAECDKSTDTTRGKVDYYKKLKTKEPDMTAQLCNVLIALDEPHKRKKYLFENPTSKDPIFISVDSFFNRFNRDLTAFYIY